MKTVIIDNFDSFTYNLVRYIHIVTKKKPCVYRNDNFNLSDLEQFDVIILSPGPGLPKEAGKTMEVLKTFSSSKKILGVCLGHQAIAEYFGSQLTQLTEVKHGVSSPLSIIKKEGIFKNITNNTPVGRYHSWTVAKNQLSKDLIITATTTDDTIMALKHCTLPIYGVQFHPESILTTEGIKIIDNFYKI